MDIIHNNGVVFQAYGTQGEGSVMVGHSTDLGASQGEPSMVEGRTDDMEWSVVDPATNSNGHLQMYRVRVVAMMAA
ncbi:hypothetical protein BGX26_004070, partial [Mortierella sp. AD094]